MPFVSKYIDTSTCIGCKACEVACQEWNDLPPETTVSLGTYQTLPDVTPQFWNLIRFNEQSRSTATSWLMRKDQCMHCADPGCLRACPAPGAIVQYENGIVDFQPENCIGCGYCVSGCPFNVPAFSHRPERCTSAPSAWTAFGGAGTGLHQGLSDELPAIRHQGKPAAQGKKRVDQLKATGFATAGIYDPGGVGGTGVVSILAYADKPEPTVCPPIQRSRPRSGSRRDRFAGSASWPSAG